MRKFFLTFTVFFLLLPSASFAYSKDNIGLNVHWALGGFNKDDLYRQRLKESKTRWVREHFYNEVLMDEASQEGWFNRYDLIMERYEKLDIKVVGMLAYGKEHDDFYQPDLEQWANFVETVVQRYKDDVVAWEVWNEPDSPNFLTPHNPETYIPILKTAYPIIRRYDKNAIVITGGIASPNHHFIERFYTEAKGFFDAIAFHVYTCRDPDYVNLQNMLGSVNDVLARHNPEERVWVTEIGCSTGSPGITPARATQYQQDALDILFSYPWVERVFLYNIRNRDDVDDYENNFGLLDVDMQPLPGWDWYASIPRGPYDQWRINLETEQEKAVALRAKLEKYFGEGLIPVSQQNWPTLVNAYVYGGYPVQAIVQSIRFGGKTVHPSIPFEQWQKHGDYQENISRGWTGKMFVHAYGKPRKFVSLEAAKSVELRTALENQYDYGQLRITNENWQKLLDAYVYGGYPVESIARAPMYGFKTVHAEIPWNVWKERAEYQEFIGKPVPTKE